MVHRRLFAVSIFLLLANTVIPVHALDWVQLGCDEHDTPGSYVLLAKDTVVIEANARVRSGDVGANSDGGGSVTVTVGPNVDVSKKSKIKGDYIWLKTNTKVGDIYYNQIKKGSNVKIRGTEYTPLDLPVSSLPYFPSFSPGTTDITVPMGQTYTLSPGNYGDVVVMPNAKLIFTGGVYNLNSLDARDGSKLYFNAASEVRIEEDFCMGLNGKIQPKPGSGIHASDIIFYVKGSDNPASVVMDYNVNVKANIYAPNGTIWLKTNVNAEGAFIGEKIKVGLNVVIKWKSAFTEYAKADKLCIFFTNDGTHAYFKEMLAASPDPSSFTYTVYLDKPAGDTYPQDFRLVYSSGTAELQSWDGSSWNYVEDIVVTTAGNSLTFNVSLQSIANLAIEQDTNVWFAEYYGSNSFGQVVDRAPNTGSYFISSEVIPELPWPTPLIFVPAVVAAVFIIYKRGFKRDG